MTNQHPTELLPWYVYDLLDTESAKSISEHLLSCASCQAQVQLLREQLPASTSISIDAANFTLSPHVKRRLMARIHNSAPALAQFTLMQRARGSLAIGSTFVIMLVAVYFLYSLNQHNLTVATLLTPTIVTGTPQLNLSILVNTPGTIAYTLAATDYVPGAKATLYIHKGDPHVGLVTEQLPPAPHGHTYQLWVAAGDTQVSLGTFDPQTGHAEMIAVAPAPIDNYTDAMVTIEPIGGSTKPSTRIVWALGL